MIHLITGGSGSGKSEYAEKWLTEKTSGNASYVYIATMKPYGTETLKKIERHRKMRAGRGFDTVENYVDLHLLNGMNGKGVLLECMSNLVANEMYRDDMISNTSDQVVERVVEGIFHIAEQAENLAIVTNEVGADLAEYSEETKEYIRILGKINQKLAGKAERVTEVVYGIPVGVK